MDTDEACPVCDGTGTWEPDDFDGRSQLIELVLNLTAGQAHETMEWIRRAYPGVTR